MILSTPEKKIWLIKRSISPYLLLSFEKNSGEKNIKLGTMNAMPHKKSGGTVNCSTQKNIRTSRVQTSQKNATLYEKGVLKQNTSQGRAKKTKRTTKETRHHQSEWTPRKLLWN